MKQVSHLRQQQTYRWGCYRSSPDQRHHTIAVYSAVHFAIGRQYDPRRPEAGLADDTAAALKAAWQKQGAPAAVAFLEGAVLIICKVVFGAHVSRPTTKAEQAGTAVPPRWEEGTTDTEERLKERERWRKKHKRGNEVREQTKIGHRGQKPKWTCFVRCIYLVGWGTSLLIRKPVGINREAEGGPLDAVLRLRLVKLVSDPPLLLLLPLLPLLPPVASLLGTFRAELWRPRGGLRGGAPSSAVLPALRGCCRGNLPANRSTNTVVMATQRLSQRLSLTRGESLAAESSMRSRTSLRHLLKMDAWMFSCKPKHCWIRAVITKRNAALQIAR